MVSPAIEIVFLVLEIFVLLSFIALIVFSFIIKSKANNLKELKIKTDFESNINLSLNFLDDEYENNKTNKYKEFFEKYNLKEGQTFKDSENISSSLEKIYEINYAIAILLIISIIFLIISYLTTICSPDPSPDYSWVIYFFISGIIIVGRCIILIILVGVFAGYFSNYKKEFENDFFSFYDNISNNIEKELFKEYYQDLFDIKNYFIFSIIFLPFCTIITIGHVFKYIYNFTH